MVVACIHAIETSMVEDQIRAQNRMVVARVNTAVGVSPKPFLLLLQKEWSKHLGGVVLNLSYNVILLHGCPRLSQHDCCLPFPCIHAQTMQHCQHSHTASSLSILTWAGQQSATMCLWYSRTRTTNAFGNKKDEIWPY
jgi:hypothetical protein